MERKNVGKKFMKNVLLLEITIVLIIIVIGAFLFHYIEWYKLLDGFYFIVMTMSTIGFGDITPKTDVGKIMVMIYAFMWVPFFISISGLLLESRFNRRIKSYINKLHRELHDAETEIRGMEEKVSKELEWTLELDGEATQKDIKTTKKTVERIEEELEGGMIKKPRWKKILKK